jgi:hypothetical protein
VSSASKAIARALGDDHEHAVALQEMANGIMECTAS